MEIVLILVVLAAAGLLWLWLQRTQFAQERGDVTAQLARRELLTAAEAEFAVVLEAALPEYRIFGQVAMSALVTTRRGIDRQESSKARNRYDRKIVDFVVCDRASGRGLVIVELDDASHDSDLAKGKDALRDAMTSAAGYPTVRISNRPWPNAAKVRAQVAPAIAALSLSAPR